MAQTITAANKPNQRQTSDNQPLTAPEKNRAELADTLGAIYRTTKALTAMGMEVIPGKDVGPTKIERVAAALFTEGVVVGNFYPSSNLPTEQQLRQNKNQFELDNHYQLGLLASVLKSAELTGTIAANSEQFSELGSTLKVHTEKLREIIARASRTPAFKSLEESTSQYLSSLLVSLNNTRPSTSPTIQGSAAKANLNSDMISRIRTAITAASTDPKSFLTSGLVLEEPNLSLPKPEESQKAGANTGNVQSEGPINEAQQVATDLKLSPAQNREQLENALIAIHHVTNTLQQTGMTLYLGKIVDSVKAPRVAASLFTEGVDVGTFYSLSDEAKNRSQFNLENHYQLSLLASALMKAEITAAIAQKSPQFAEVGAILKGHAKELRTIIARASGTEALQNLTSITTEYFSQLLESVRGNSQSRPAPVVNSFKSAGLEENTRRDILSAIGKAYASPNDFIMNGVQVRSPDLSIPPRMDPSTVQRV